MTTADIRDYFIESFPWNGSCSIGKIDKNKDTAVCFYLNTPQTKQTAFGGKKNVGSDFTSVSILLRGGKNAKTAEELAQRIYDFFDEKTYYHKQKRVFVLSRYDSPVPLGTDESGIYEYSFEFDFYKQKG